MIMRKLINWLEGMIQGSSLEPLRAPSWMPTVPQESESLQRKREECIVWMKLKWITPPQAPRKPPPSP